MVKRKVGTHLCQSRVGRDLALLLLVSSRATVGPHCAIPNTVLSFNAI